MALYIIVVKSQPKDEWRIYTTTTQAIKAKKIIEYLFVNLYASSAKIVRVK